MSHDDLSQHPQLPAFPDDFVTDPHRCVPPSDDLADVDERFVFEFRAYDDDLADGQRWST
jgi:RIO kinase 1